MPASRTACALATVAGLLLAGAPAAGASLALTSADTPGLRQTAIRSAVARTLLTTSVGIASRPAMRRAPLAASALARSPLALADIVATVPSSGAAARVVAGAPGRAVTVGDGGHVRTTRVAGRVRAVVVFRLGDAIGLVRVTTSGSAAAGQRRAVAYARVAAARILRLRARPGWDRVLLGVRADGTVPAAVALRAFALEYGGLPGVRRPAGPAGFDGTAAIAAVQANWGSLTSTQRAAVRALGIGAPTRGRAASALTPSPTYQAIADSVAAIYAGHLGDLPFPIVVYRSSLPRPDVAAFADALPISGPRRCRIRLFPMLFADTSEAMRTFVVAHEVFHCFEFAATGNWPWLAPYVLEGMAEWAGLSATQAADEPAATAYLATYYATPAASLLRRTYGGAGFWGAVDQAVTGGLWPRVHAVLNVPSGAAAFSVAGGDLDVMHASWASLQLRSPALGSAWNQTDPVVLPAAAAPPDVKSLAGSAAIASGAYATALYSALPLTTPRLVLVTATAGTVHAASPQDDVADANGQWFCMGGECRCPPGERAEIPDNLVVPGQLALALTGGSDPAAGRVAYHDVKEFCGSRVRSWTGTWASTVYPINGTYHLVLGGPDSSLAGFVEIGGSSCVTGGAATGALVGTAIRFGAVHAEREVGYTGHVIGSAMAGYWTSPSCGGDAGTFSGTRDP